MSKMFRACSKCKQPVDGKIPSGYYLEKMDLNGYQYEIIKECEHHIGWRHNEEYHKIFINSGFKKENWNYTTSEYLGNKSKNNIQRFENYVSKYKEEPSIRSAVLYFYGTPGTQKTTIANWIGKELIKKKISVKYTTMRTLGDNLMGASGFAKDDRKEECLNNCDMWAHCDLLILDESFDRNKVSTMWKSELQLGNFSDFIRTRINRSRGMIIISNSSLDQLEKEDMDKSLLDLIRRECIKYNSIFEFKDNYRDTENENSLNTALRNLF